MQLFLKLLIGILKMLVIMFLQRDTERKNRRARKSFRRILTAANIVFQNGGNTYIYQDLATGGTSVAGLDDGDVVIELVGLFDLTLLIADLASLT